MTDDCIVNLVSPAETMVCAPPDHPNRLTVEFRMTATTRRSKGLRVEVSKVGETCFCLDRNAERRGPDI